MFSGAALLTCLSQSSEKRLQSFIDQVLVTDSLTPVSRCTDLLTDVISRAKLFCVKDKADLQLLTPPSCSGNQKGALADKSSSKDCSVKLEQGQSNGKAFALLLYKACCEAVIGYSELSGRQGCSLRICTHDINNLSIAESTFPEKT